MRDLTTRKRRERERERTNLRRRKTEIYKRSKVENLLQLFATEAKSSRLDSICLISCIKSQEDSKYEMSRGKD